MLAGPVFQFELVRIARRRRTFVLRFAFGMFVLAIIALNYAGHSGSGRPWYSPGVVSIGELAQFGRTLFEAIMATQAALVLGLTPTLVADAIASERQSKTLHYLLASRLGSGEIVLGKLAARLLGIGVFPALVLPILSLLTLIGGVSPAGLILGYAAIASSTYFLASLALLVSVLARRPRDAVGAAYFLTAVWLFLPPLLDAWRYWLPSPWADVALRFKAVSEWAWPASPLGIVTHARAIFGGGTDGLWWFTTWMVGSHAAFGTLFIALAAWQLRPAFRRHEGHAGRPMRSARLARHWFPIRPCGDDPIFWKEAYFSGVAGGLGRRIARLLVPCLMALAIVGTIVGSRAAFRELWEQGYGFGDYTVYQQRMGLNFALRYAGALLSVIWLLWLAGVTAAGVTSEREQDTWISLLATPLEGDAILRGKMLGPLRATAPCGVAILTMWLIGLAAGAVHPLGFLNAVAVLALLVWFVVALGTYASLKSKATWRARLWAQGLLIAPNVCCYLPIPSALILVGVSLWSYAEIHGLTSVSDWWDNSTFILLASAHFFGGIALYAGAAYFLTRAVFRSFDVLADRPRRAPGGDVILVETKPAPEKDPADAELVREPGPT